MYIHRERERPYRYRHTDINSLLIKTYMKSSRCLLVSIFYVVPSPKKALKACAHFFSRFCSKLSGLLGSIFSGKHPIFSYHFLSSLKIVSLFFALVVTLLTKLRRVEI